MPIANYVAGYHAHCQQRRRLSYPLPTMSPVIMSIVDNVAGYHAHC